MKQGSVFGLLTGSQVARFALPAPELPPESVPLQPSLEKCPSLCSPSAEQALPHMQQLM